MFNKVSILAVALFGVVSATASANAMNFVKSQHETATYMYSGMAAPRAADAMTTGSVATRSEVVSEPRIRVGVVSPRITGVNPYIGN